MKELVEKVTERSTGSLNLRLDFKKIPEGPKMGRKSLNYFPGYKIFFEKNQILKIYFEVS